jgi:hypothetical protein
MTNTHAEAAAASYMATNGRYMHTNKCAHIEGLGLVDRVPSGYVAKINIP